MENISYSAPEPTKGPESSNTSILRNIVSIVGNKKTAVVVTIFSTIVLGGSAGFLAWRIQKTEEPTEKPAAAGICSSIGASCSETYSESCTTSDGKDGTKVCHKQGTCDCIGGGTCCTWGGGSYCESCVANDDGGGGGDDGGDDGGGGIADDCPCGGWHEGKCDANSCAEKGCCGTCQSGLVFCATLGRCQNSDENCPGGTDCNPSDDCTFDCDGRTASASCNDDCAVNKRSLDICRGTQNHANCQK